MILRHGPLGLVVGVLLCCLAFQDLPQTQAHHGNEDGHVGRLIDPDYNMELFDDDERRDFFNYTLLTIRVRDDEDMEVLDRIENYPGVDFWQKPNVITRTANVLLAPQIYGLVSQQLEDNYIPYRISVDNIKDVIEASNPKPDYGELAVLTQTYGHALDFKRYHRYDTIMDFLDHIDRQKESGCDGFSLGYSYEGRRLAGLKCGRGRRAIFIEGGMHAREWISPAVVTYFINEITKDQAHRSPELSEILDLYTIYLVPIINPDGYEFTHTHNRMWRKTRSRSRYASRCVGVDGNRNFDVHFGEASSPNWPCRDLYPGEKPFSEPETQALRNFFSNRYHGVDLYVSLHSFSQLILVPYAFTRERPSDYARMERVAQIGNSALQKAGGPKFTVEQPSRILYSASGCSYDWMKVHGGVPYSYTMELRDRGRYGFLLPPSYISQSGRETLAAVLAMAGTIAKEQPRYPGEYSEEPRGLMADTIVKEAPSFPEHEEAQIAPALAEE